jgi:putative tryptophan/tyrosine transport system substrate-binding protein
LFRDFAKLGGFMAYGPNMDDRFCRLGGYVGRILHGARPSDLPTPVLLATADEVIE